MLKNQYKISQFLKIAKNEKMKIDFPEKSEILKNKTIKKPTAYSKPAKPNIYKLKLPRKKSSIIRPLNIQITYKIIQEISAYTK